MKQELPETGGSGGAAQGSLEEEIASAQGEAGATLTDLSGGAIGGGSSEEGEITAVLSTSDAAATAASTATAAGSMAFQSNTATAESDSGLQYRIQGSFPAR